MFVSFSSFLYRYLDGIKDKKERNDVVNNLARELNDLDLDPTRFLIDQEESKGESKGE